MQDNRKTNHSRDVDRMGRFIGQLRVHEGITLQQLARGLCTVSYLNRVENGEREVGKQLTDAFFQRLGKPVELFERILDWDEFQQWKQRQEILTHLNSGDVAKTRACMETYREISSGVLDEQFLAIVEINCCALEDADANQLLEMVKSALQLTQPDFGTAPVDSLLFSQNEGRLFFAYLQLRERLEGYAAVAGDYHALLQYFKHPRYESRERVYLYPYVAVRVIENEFREKRYSDALTICQEALDELTIERRLFAYDQLLEWKQKLHDVMENPDQTPGKLLTHLKNILSYAPKPLELLVPCEERGNVYCFNDVIRTRRRLLGLSQEELAEGICQPVTISRIENHSGKVQRKNRRALLQRVNMSGERYDYEIITDSYEDYLLRSELDRSVAREDWNTAQSMVSELSKRTSDTPTNRQYFLRNKAYIKTALPDGHPEKLATEDRAQYFRNAINLSLPLDFDSIATWPECVLSINEIMALLPLANCYEKTNQKEKSLSILSFLKNSLKNLGVKVSLYASIDTRVDLELASVLGSLGRYLESSVHVKECIEVSIKNHVSAILARALCGEAWNIAGGLDDLSGEEYKLEVQKVLGTLQQAYAAALISGDMTRQKNIPAYCRRKFNIEISL